MSNWGQLAVAATPQPFSDVEADARLAAWLDERCGKLTASNMGLAIDCLKNGEPSAKQMKLLKDLLAERVTGLSVRHYVTPAMQWGIDTEPEAKLAFTAATGIKLLPSRYYDHPTIDACGATPDAEIGDDGLVEIKCPTTSTYIDWVMGGVVPEEHKPQLLLQLAVTRRQYTMFVAFDPRLKNEKDRLFIRRFEPTPAMIADIEAKAEHFLATLDAMFDAFVTACHA